VFPPIILAEIRPENKSGKLRSVAFTTLGWYPSTTRQGTERDIQQIIDRAKQNGQPQVSNSKSLCQKNEKVPGDLLRPY